MTAIDDEREALAQVIFDRSHTPHDPLILGDYDINMLADAILAAGFRRQGPTTDEWEYAREYTDEGGDPRIRVVSAADQLEHRPDGHRADGSPYWNYVQKRRRKAGPWEPVEAGTPHD